MAVSAMIIVQNPDDVVLKTFDSPTPKTHSQNQPSVSPPIMANYTLTDPLNLTASGIMIIIGIFGLLCNALIIYIFVKNPSERTSFNLICTFRAVGNSAIFLWGFFATFLPITFLGDTPFSPEYETVVIGLCNSIYKCLQYSGLLIAVNRCCAMFFPFLYSKLFSFNFTLLVTILVFTLPIAYVIYQIVSFGIRIHCFLIFDPISLAWYADFADECAQFSDGEVDFTTAFLAVLVVVNVATFTKIYIFYKSTDMEQKELMKKVKKNRSLFMQTMFQDVIILLDILFTLKLSQLSNNRIWTFFCGTVIWGLVHSLDGLIMLLFNNRLTILRETLFGFSETSTVTHQSRVFQASPRAAHSPTPVH